MSIPARSGPAAALLVLLALLTSGASGAAAQSAPVRRVKPEPPPVQFDHALHAELVEASSLIRVGEGRSTYAVNGTGLTVAVLDSGIRATHRDFVGRIVAQRNFTTDNGGNPNDATDGNGHGTNVAGIVAANGIHVGMAPAANIVALKVLDNSGNGDFNTTLAALDWVIANRDIYNITAVNLSLGDGGNYVTQPFDSLEDRIRTLRGAGVAVIAAAGNSYFELGSRQGMGYPAVLPETISVGAVYDANIGSVSYGGATANTTAPDRICPFSQRLHSTVNASTRTDVFAPGAALKSSGISSDSGESTMHGTSQAAPVISGIVLLMQEYYKRRKFVLPTVDQLESWLRAGAVSIHDGDDEDDNVAHTNLDFPRVDALAAMQAEEAEIGIGSFKISGTVTSSGMGLAGVTVSAGTAGATTRADGTYTITGLSAGSYTVTPSLTGFTFDPVNVKVTVGPDKTAVDFTATADPVDTTFDLAGTVRVGTAGLKDTLVSITGTSGSTTLMTDATGHYRAADLAGGTYTVRVAHTGYTFTPTARVVDLHSDQLAIDFSGTATVVTYTVQGEVTAGGGALSGVTISAGGRSATTTSTGHYTLTGLAAGEYLVSASKTNYTFAPASRVVDLGPSAQNVDFTGTQTAFSISGTVRVNGVGRTGFTVRASGVVTSTGSTGRYTLTGLAPGTYQVTAEQTGYTVAPDTQSVTVAPDRTGVDFTATASGPPTFSISGRITAGGVGVAGIGVRAGTRLSTTSGTGAYTITGLQAGSYTVTPTASGLRFNPISRTADVSADVAGVDFDALSGASLSALRLSRSSARGGKQSVTGTVQFTGKVKQATTVTLSSDTPSTASVPATLRVAKGKSSATFRVKTHRPPSGATVTLTAQCAGVTRQATLTVKR